MSSVVTSHYSSCTTCSLVYTFYLNERWAFRCTVPSMPVKKKFSAWPPPLPSKRTVSRIWSRGAGSTLPLRVHRQPRTNRHGFSWEVRIPESISGGGKISRAMFRSVPDASCPALRRRRSPLSFSGILLDPGSCSWPLIKRKTYRGKAAESRSACCTLHMRHARVPQIQTISIPPHVEFQRVSYRRT